MGRPTLIGTFTLIACLVGCTTDSGIVHTGPSTYRVTRRSAHGYSQPGILIASAEREAGDYCRSHDGTAVIVTSREAPPPYLFGNYPRADVGFYCQDNPQTSAAGAHP